MISIDERSEAPGERGAGEAAAGEAVSRDNPFPGPRPFSQDEAWLFFGRDQELSELVALLFAQRAMLLHGPSGVGKSSLVHAGFIPRVRSRGFEVLPVARVRDATLGADGYSTGNRYLHNVIENWREAGLAIPPGAVTLTDALSGLPPAEDPGRVVVFDQFEEIFVVHPESWKDRTDLLLQVQRALDADPLLHVVFVLRDDYLARLQPLTPVLRDRLSTRYHLRGLSSRQALDAVVRPFAATGRSFAPGVAEDLVKAIRTQPAVAPDTRSYEAEDVEPVQLQIVCRTFFDRLPPGTAEVTAGDVALHADVNQALVGFYEQALTGAVKSHRRVSERKVRLWFERRLITPARSRGIVYRDERETAGLANEVVDDLEERRIVRSEPRGPATWYELPHDRLIDPVLNSNRAWFAARSRTVTRLSAALGVLGVLIGVASLVLVNLGDGGSPADPDRYEISRPGDVVRRPVTATAGQQITAIMSTGGGFTGELRLLDATGTIVAQAGGIDQSPVVLTRRVAADGEYQLEARAKDESYGEFSMSYGARTVDVSEAQLTPGQPLPGRIGSAGEVDIYQVLGRAGAVAQITAAAEGSVGIGLVATDPRRPAIADGGSSGLAAVLAFVVPDDGTYEVQVSSGDGKAGNYRLDLELLDNAPAPESTTGALDPRNRADVGVIRSDSGGVLSVSFSPSAYSGVQLLTADGRVLQGVSTGDEETTNQLEPWPIAPGVTYLVVLRWYNGSGPYFLSYAIDAARPLSDGRAAGDLTEEGQQVTFRLDGGPDDVDVLVAPEAGLDLFAGVVQPDGSVLEEADDHSLGQDELFTVHLSDPGPHLLVVGSRSSDGPTGHFDVTVR